MTGTKASRTFSIGTWASMLWGTTWRPMAMRSAYGRAGFPRAWWSAWLRPSSKIGVSGGNSHVAGLRHSSRPQSPPPPAILAVVRMTLGTFAWLLRQSLISTLDDGCFGYAKAAAYSALLSFFPVLTSAATILVQTRAEFVSATLESFLSQIVPPGTEDLVVQQFRVMGERPAGFLIAAGIISLWAASGVIKSLIEGFQAAYRVPRNRDFFRQSGVAMS